MRKERRHIMCKRIVRNARSLEKFEIQETQLRRKNRCALAGGKCASHRLSRLVPPIGAREEKERHILISWIFTTGPVGVDPRRRFHEREAGPGMY